MSFFNELADVTAESIETFGKRGDGSQLQLVWNGANIDCFEEDSEQTDLLRAGGLVEETDLILRALRSDFLSDPRSIQTVQFNGKTHKIRAVFGSVGDPEIRLALIGAAQR